ncbi:HXXEE domain-containing protein [Sphingomonas parva]|uniref:HXXEE domain-containing protein n=1 Tax=Sphingomonas parva TaxID=2555898 RepID=A0A4Y8ZS11_9SPHN|nr:HXXEE domain-containing protein [Sphingomonas parva]TFI57589.1 HXXEE domain-containing protein [Sphingomonas parva]
MTARAGPAPRPGPAVLWLLPAAFLIHDGEELLVWKRWMAAHGAALPEIVRRLFGESGGVAAIPIAGIAAAMGALFVLFAAVAAAAATGRRGGVQAYAVLLGGFFVHGFGHAAQALLLGGYTPGVATAVLVVIPASLFLYARLFAAGALPRRSAVLLGAAGALLVLPAILLALSLGRLAG